MRKVLFQHDCYIVISGRYFAGFDKKGRIITVSNVLGCMTFCDVAGVLENPHLQETKKKLSEKQKFFSVHCYPVYRLKKYLT
jgi:hypothetical protein